MFQSDFDSLIVDLNEANGGKDRMARLPTNARDCFLGPNPSQLFRNMGTTASASGANLMTAAALAFRDNPEQTELKAVVCIMSGSSRRTADSDL